MREISLSLIFLLLSVCYMHCGYCFAQYHKKHRIRVVHMSPSNQLVRSLRMSNDESNGPLSWVLDQNFSLGVGAAGIVLLLFNRLSLSLEVVSDVQSRADIISVIACSALLLNVLSEQEIETRERDEVALVGYAIDSSAPLVSSDATSSFTRAAQWLIDAVLSCTPVTSVHLINSNGKIEAAAGVVANTKEKLLQLPLSSGGCKILNDAIAKREEIYLPDMQILPGKVEFIYLPINCQSVFVLPIPFPTQSAGDMNRDEEVGAIVVGTNKAKNLKFVDLNRIRCAASVFCSMLE